jgi:hypothetical protein
MLIILASIRSQITNDTNNCPRQDLNRGPSWLKESALPTDQQIWYLRIQHFGWLYVFVIKSAPNAQLISLILISVLILEAFDKDDDLRFKTLKITDFGLARESANTTR